MVPRRLLSVLTALLAILCAAPQAQPPEAPAAFRWPDGRRAAVSLSFDDGRPSQMDEGLPFFSRTGAKVTFYVVPGRLDERLEAWQRAAKAGHEIGNHSLVHPCSGNFVWARPRALEGYTPARMREELMEANREIERRVGVTPVTFAYPCGQTFVGRGAATVSYVPVVSALFLAGRGWLDEAPNDPTWVDLAQIYGVSMDDQDFAELRPIVDQAIEAGAWLVLAGHDIGNGPGRQVTRLSMLADLVAYLQAPERGVWLDTVAAVARHVDRRPPPVAEPPR